ncbi:hypothetical protein CAMRE0001_1337 [Campylobacter rectus RM3267]|uniref:Uncharacterized protein n=1 Tax=Campylobacter rectus RM3267 TaxID=553218 RepID=B9D024_CAMRE|nr:hypothetical protein CAMRE0001_1337 [Campylobacter rectus RM3267]
MTFGVRKSIYFGGCLLSSAVSSRMIEPRAVLLSLIDFIRLRYGAF